MEIPLLVMVVALLAILKLDGSAPEVLQLLKIAVLKYAETVTSSTSTMTQRCVTMTTETTTMVALPLAPLKLGGVVKIPREKTKD